MLSFLYKLSRCEFLICMDYIEYICEKCKCFFCFKCKVRYLNIFEIMDYKIVIYWDKYECDLK